MSYLLIAVILFYLLGYLFAPFPMRSTYFLLWLNVIFNPAKQISFKARLKQALLLLRYAILCPFFTLLWYLDWLLYPSFKHQQVRPIFIIGTPRSGTTFLHRTLANDEQTFFAIRHIEWRYPYIVLQKLIIFFRLEEKIKKINYWPNNKAGLKAAKMHPQTLYDWEEDAIFFEECFLHHFYVMLRFPYPNLLPMLENFKKLPAYKQRHMMKIYHQVIQKMMYLKGQNKIYLSKEVASHTKLDFLVDMYPQANFIINIRKSNEFLSSILELVRLSILTKADVDVLPIEQFKTDFVGIMSNEYSCLMKFLAQDLKQKRLCITFRQLNKNPEAIVKYIYRELNLPLSNTYEKYLNELQKNQEKREKKYEYETEFFPGFEEFDQLVSKVDEDLKSK